MEVQRLIFSCNLVLFTFRSSHFGMTDNQKRWLIVGIALNKILLPQIRPFVEQELAKEYSNLRTSHNIHTQSTSGRLQRWPPEKLLKYENINGNSLHPKLPGGNYDFSLFDCRVLSHVDLAKLYVENFMAKFNAFDDHCNASAVLTLLGSVPVFSVPVQAAAAYVQVIRNAWAHCVFSKWDLVKCQQSFFVMESMVRVMAPTVADEAKLLLALKSWETAGITLYSDRYFILQLIILVLIFNPYLGCYSAEFTLGPVPRYPYPVFFSGVAYRPHQTSYT